MMAHSKLQGARPTGNKMPRSRTVPAISLKRSQRENQGQQRLRSVTPGETKYNLSSGEALPVCVTVALCRAHYMYRMRFRMSVLMLW